MESKPTKISFSDTDIAYTHYSNRKLKKALGVYQLIGNNFLTNIGTTLTKIALAIRFPIKPFVKPIIFDQFCGGENLKECIP
ncbi:MAG: proline dehydrogenase, partial [Chitinophagales bacterium]